MLVGPTAVGKTAAAIALAEAVSPTPVTSFPLPITAPVEIVSADSRYLYRGLDIGTAKPSPADLARVPHHLIDVTTPDQPWSLSQYQAAAYAAIDAIQAGGGLPLLVGGTGQYIRALTEGWQVPAGEPQGQVRAELEVTLAREGVAALAERLRSVDPASAATVDLRNPRRVIRALEVVLTTGESFAAQRRRQPPPYSVHTFGLTLPRAELYARIDARVDAMLAAGLVAEVEALVAKGYDWDLPAMSALGYRQIGDYLRGEATLAEAVARLKRDTRQLVRRQGNWFKPTDPDIHWFEAHPGVAADMAKKVRLLFKASQRP